MLMILLRRNTVPGHPGYGGVPVYMICLVPVADADSVAISAST